MCIHTHQENQEKKKENEEYVFNDASSQHFFFFAIFLVFSSVSNLFSYPVGIIDTSSNTHHLHRETPGLSICKAAAQSKSLSPTLIQFRVLLDETFGGGGINGSFKVLFQIMMPKCFKLIKVGRRAGG